LAGKQSGGQKLEGSLRGGNFLPACRSEAPSPCSFRAEVSKKVFFSFYLPAEASAQAGKKKSGARKLKNAKKTFLRNSERSERQRGVAFKIRNPDFRQKKFGF